jgi:putative aldouronate transport system substrate-binding protein
MKGFMKVMAGLLVAILVISIPALEAEASFIRNLFRRNQQETQESHPTGLSHVNLVMYLLGDEPNDKDIVYEQLNALLLEKINATLTTNYLSWGDWQDKYSLILAAGDNIDMIFTADWAFYATEAAKGAFHELTPEFLETYMPMTLESQNPAAIGQATIDGKLFAMPKNGAGMEGENWIMVRKDLREKYGMDEIKTVEDLEAYFKAVLANEDGVFPHAAAGDGGFLSTMHTQPNQIFSIGNTDIVFQYPGNNDAPPASDFTYRWFRDDMIPYFEKMREWGELGFWSRNAINNDVQVRDSFENGRSAALTWNATIFRAMENLRSNNPEWDGEAIDINPNTPRRQAYFTNDAIAIAAASRNPGRAAMFIDLVKNDMDVYMALVGGIEGKHYNLIDVDKRIYTHGSDFDDYPWNPSTWCFNLDPLWMREGSPIEEVTFLATQEPLIANPDTMAFRFNVEPVRHEMAAIDALRDEYRPMLQLGMVADINGTVAEWKSKAEASGLEKVMEEFRTQYNAWLESR